MADQKHINAESLNHAAGTTCSLLHLISRRLALEDGRLMIEFEMTCIETERIQLRGDHSRTGTKTPVTHNLLIAMGLLNLPIARATLMSSALFLRLLTLFLIPCHRRIPLVCRSGCVSRKW